MGDIKIIIIAAIIFSGVIVGISNFYGDIASAYNIQSTDVSFLNKSLELANEVRALQNRTAQPPAQSELGVFNPFSAIEVAKLSGKSVDILITMVGDASDPTRTNLGSASLPSWASIVIIGVLMTIVLFVIVRAWLKWDL